MPVDQTISKLLENINKVVIGKEESVKNAVICLLCKGHLLVEDIPGVGKTVLAKTISLSVDADFKRVQFTPDLMPADVTGTNIFDQQKSEFRFRKGPVFANILLADEINRATPRTQSSLLEAMAEQQVTTDGVTRPLPELFFVIATQNPIDLQGTFALPEAQLDRFFMKINMGYPELDDEVRILKDQNKFIPVDKTEKVISTEEVIKLQNSLADIHVEESLLFYIAHIIQATREHDDIDLGASPRGTLALRRAAQACAFIEGSDFVSPDHIKEIAVPVLRHRMTLQPQARLMGVEADTIIQQALDSVEVPIT